MIDTMAAGSDDSRVIVSVSNASPTAQLDAWIDFDADGTRGPDEQIFDSVAVTNGLSERLFAVPETAVAGTTYARFRVSSTGGLEPTGPAPDGDDDGLAGGDHVFGAAEADAFFRWFGDRDGSRFVGNNDDALFRVHFRTGLPFE